MGKALLRWRFLPLIRTIVATLLNKFDCFIVIEGMTGVGKSTLAYEIASAVSREFRRLFNLNEDKLELYYEKVTKRHEMTKEKFIEMILALKEKKAYRFIPRKDLIYSQKEMMEFLSSWYRIAIPDEMINITFNRDFQHTEQKNIIKMINMYRDHQNLIIACVPFFQTLDNQIKNLCKVRFTVVRRGLAIIQTPNRTIHIRDRWDSATNEKIERDWLKKGKMNPVYTRMTTTRGIIHFPKLPENIEIKYQKIKDEKRTIILREDMEFELEKKPDILSSTVKMLLEGQIKNSDMLKAIAVANGMTSEKFKDNIRKELEKLGKTTSLRELYSQKSAKEETEKTFRDMIVG